VRVSCGVPNVASHGPYFWYCLFLPRNRILRTAAASRVRRTYRASSQLCGAHDPRASFGPEMRTNTYESFTGQGRAGMGRFPGDSDVLSSV
jgi:hypothetical protein